MIGANVTACIVMVGSEIPEFLMTDIMAGSQRTVKLAFAYLSHYILIVRERRNLRLFVSPQPVRDRALYRRPVGQEAVADSGKCLAP